MGIIAGPMGNMWAVTTPERCAETMCPDIRMTPHETTSWTEHSK